MLRLLLLLLRLLLLRQLLRLLLMLLRGTTVRTGQLGRAGDRLAHCDPGAAGSRGVIEPRVLQQQRVALGGVEGQGGHRGAQSAAGPGRVRTR